MRTRGLRALVAAAAALGVGVAHAHLPERRIASSGEMIVLRPQVAKLAALGFDSVLADYYWLRVVQVVGAEKRDPSRHAKLIGRIVDVVTTLDPWVQHPYQFAAVWMTDSERSVREANRLLERAIRYHPDDWRNYFYLGFNLFYYLGESEQAAQVLEKTIPLPGRPLYLPRLVARLRAGREGLDAAEAFLRQLAHDAPNGYARAEYEKALDEIATERIARRLDAARLRYRERHGRDIREVEDLVRGPDPVLSRLPPEPHGWEWVLSESTGEIVSSYYGHRYRPQFAPRARRFYQAPANEGKRRAGQRGSVRGASRS